MKARAKKATKPKILLVDIETSFKLACVWGRFQQNISMNQVIQDTYVITWAAKWLEDDYIYSDKLDNYPKAYKADPTDDKHVLESVWELLDEADFVVAHNAARFDVPSLNARFIQQGMQPPSSFKVIDTLRIARRAFKFTSNRLDDLGMLLKVGRKMDTGGFDLWKNVVLQQDRKALKKMSDYCEQDVILLEDVYLKLRPWDDKHPSTVMLTDLDKPRCNVCGSEHIVKNGSYATNTQRYQKYKCGTCGHNLRHRKADKLEPEQKNNILRSI